MDFFEVYVAEQETCRLAPTGTEGAHANTMKTNLASVAKFHNTGELEEVAREGILEAPRNGQLLT